MTISFLSPSVLGSCRIFTGSLPAMQAAACNSRPPAAPLHTNPASAPTSPGDLPSRSAIQVIHVNHYAGRLFHQLQGLGPGARPAQAGDGTGGVDDGLDTQALVKRIDIP